jgi:hypothetical protein
MKLYYVLDFGDHVGFRDFLDCNDSLEKFIDGFYDTDEDWKINYWVGYIESGGDYTIKDFLDNMDKDNNTPNYVNYAFEWAGTKGGKKFWGGINREWKSNNYRYV